MEQHKGYNEIPLASDLGGMPPKLAITDLSSEPIRGALPPKNSRLEFLVEEIQVPTPTKGLQKEFLVEWHMKMFRRNAA